MGEQNNTNLKSIIIIVLLLFIGSIIYTVKMSFDVDVIQDEMTKTTTEKDSLLTALQDLKVTYDAAILDKTALSDELAKEREKVASLIAKLKRSRGGTEVKTIKTQTVVLRKDMESLIAENEQLKKQNAMLTIQKDSISVAFEELKKVYDEFVAKSSDISVINLQLTTYKVKGSGKKTPTDKASKVNQLNITFAVAENPFVEAQDLEYYVQVIGGDSKVIGDAKKIKIGEEEITYSIMQTVNYQKETVLVTMDMAGKKLFEKGVAYTVNVYDDEKLVASQKFSLK